MRWTFLLLLAILSVVPAWGQNTGLAALGASVQNADGSISLSMPMQIAVGLTLLTLLPAVIMSITPFLRTVIVLHFLRQALGTQTTPSNQILIGLALSVRI